MSAHAEVIRPILFVVRLLLWISAVITLALAAWIVDHNVTGYRAVFPLVIVRNPLSGLLLAHCLYPRSALALI